MHPVHVPIAKSLSQRRMVMAAAKAIALETRWQRSVEVWPERTGMRLEVRLSPWAWSGLGSVHLFQRWKLKRRLRRASEMVGVLQDINGVRVL